MRSSVRVLAALLPAVFGFAGCGESHSSSGTPDASGSASVWLGKTYLLDNPNFAAANWTMPAGFGADIGAYVPQFLIGVAAGSGSDLTITIATASGGAQDLCNVTTQVSASGASYPDIKITLPTFPMRIVDSNPAHAKVVQTTGHDVILTNVLPGDKPAMDGQLDATMDISELYPLFYQIPNPTPATVCSTFKSLGGIDCETCSFDPNQQPYCLTLQAVQIGATLASTQITPVSAGNIGASCP